MTLTNNTDKGAIDTNTSDVVIPNGSSGSSRQPEGRISRTGAIVKQQLLNLSYDQYHIHTSSNIALVLFRGIKSTPVRIRKTVAFVRRIRNQLIVLNNYNRATFEAKGKYPYSKALILLLVRYVQLEYDVLYHSENYSAKYEEEVEGKVRHFLYLLLDGVARRYKGLNTDDTATECVLRVLNEVSTEYKVKGRFIYSLINKLAKKLGLLETISEIRQNGILFQNHPAFQKLSCDSIDNISDCESDDACEIPTSPARSCESPFDTLKLQSPKREPPDLDSGQGLKFPFFDDDYDDDSFIYGVHRLKSQQMNLFGPRSEIVDYSSNGDDYIDLITERVNDKSVQNIDNKDDSNCVAIQSTNEHKICRDVTLNRDDHDVAFGCSVYSNNNRPVTVDCPVSRGNKKNTKRSKNNSASSKASPNRIQNSSEVIDLVDNDDVIEVIEFPPATPAVNNARQVPSTSANKVEEIYLVDDDDDCVIIENQEEIPNKFNDEQTSEKRATSDNQVNEISSTTGKEELVFHSTDCPDSSSAKNKDFEDGLAEIPVNAFVNRLTDSLRTTSPEIYEKMNQLEQENGQVHALEDLTPETQGDDVKATLNQSINEKCDENGSETTQRVSSDLGILKSTEFLQMNILEEASKKSRLLEESSGSNSIVDITEPEETIVDQITPVEETTKNEVDVIVIQETISVSTEINLKSSILEVTTPKDTIDLVNNKETKGNITEINEVIDQCVELNRPETVSTMNLSSEFELTTANDISANNLINNEDVPTEIAEVNKISDEGVESNQLNLSSRLEVITSGDVVDDDQIQEIIGEINDVDSNQQQAIPILNSLSVPEICLDTETTDEKLIKLQKSDHHPPGKDEDGSSVFDKIDQSVTPILSQDLNISQNEVVENVVENNTSHNIEPEESFNLPPIQEKMSSDEQFVDAEKLTTEIYQEEPLEANKEKSLQENVIAVAYDVDIEEKIEDNNTILVDAEAQIDNANTQQNYAFVSSLEVTNSLEIEGEEIIEDNTVVLIADETQIEDVTTKQNYTSAWYSEVTDSVKNQSEEKLSISDKFHQTSIIPLDNSADDRSIEREDCEDPVKYANLDYTISPTIEGLNKECNISMEANESNEDPTSKGQNSSEGTKRMLTITDEGNTKLEDNKDEILQSEQIDPEENLISNSQESDVNPPKSILDLHESPIESGSDLANIKVDLTSQISNLIDKEDTELVAIELENVPASSIAENREKMEKALDISREGNVISDLPKIRNDSEFIESKIESYVICEMATPSPQNNIINVTCEDIQLNTIVVANSENIDLSENTEDKIPVLSNQLNEAENNEGTIPVTEILESADIQLEISEDVLHQEESNLRSTISSVEESSICPQESEKGNKLEINLDSSELNIQCETSSSEENSKDVSSVSDLETYREVSRDFLNLEENFKNELLFETRIEVSATVVIQSNNYENLEIESNELSFPPIIIADVNCTNLENGKVDNLDESDLLHLDKTSEESSFDHLLLNKATEANDVEYNEVSVDNTNLENIKESDNSSSNDGSFLLTIDVPENIDHSKDKETIQPDQINDVVFEYTNDGVNLEQVEVADCLTNKNVLPLEQLDKAHLDDVSKDDVKDGDNSINKDELIEKTTNKSEDDYYCDGITVDITESNGDIPIELESETIQNSDTTEIKDFPKEDDGDVNKTYNQNATFDDQEIFLILPTEEIKDNELSEKNEKDEGEGVFYILNTADCEGMNFVIQDDNIGEVNQGEYTTEAIDTSKTSERDLNIEGDIENFNPKDVEYRYDEDIPTTDSEVCVDYCEFQTNQLECDNEVVLGNKEENCVNESVSDVQLCNNETSEVVDNELTSLLADLCVSTTNKQNTTVNTAAIEDINIKEKESTKINEEGCANKRQIENPDVQDKEHFKLPSFITDDAIILTEPQALNFENCVRVLEGVEGYSGDVSDDASLDSDNLEDTSCEIPPDEIKYFPAMNEFPLEDSFRYPIISERSLEESDDSRILEPDIIIEELNTSYIDHSSNFIDPDSSNSSNFIHSTLATEYYNANNLCLPNFIKTELGGEVQDADAIIRESKSYRQSFDVTLSEMENTSSKVEDPYLNLEILATAAAAQKSLKVNPKSALRSRVKMATVKVQKKSEEGFQPNEVIETVTKQPVQTVFASATESDFNTVSEDSCDSFAGKLVIAEDHKARESSPPPVYPEIKLEPEDVTIFDEDTMDEELSLISTNLQEIDNVDVQITIEESEEFVDVFDEIIKFNTDLDDECDEEENDTDDVVKLPTKYDLKDVSVDKAGSSKNSEGKKIGENVKKAVTKIKTSKTKQGLSHYYKKVPTTTINLSQTENSSSKLEITDDISIFPEKSAKRNKNIIQKKVPLKPPKKYVGKRKNKIDEPKGLKKIKEKKTLQTEIKEVISQPDEKHDRRLDENKIIIGESPMLTHDGEISQMSDLSEADGKIIIHNTIVDVTTSEVTDNLVKFCDDTMVEEQLFTGEQSIKQPIRTKAELKAYDKKNQSSDKAATTTTEDSNLIENKLNLSSYVKLIRDPHMQKLIDKQYEEVATPRVTLGRKSYKSLIDARKLMFKTHPVQNQVLKNNNVLPNIAKIEDGCPKSIGESSLETVQDKNQNLKTNDKLDEDLKISVGSNNKKIDEVCIENQIKEQEEKLKDETEKNPHPELLSKCVTTSKTDDLNNQLITATKIVKEPLPKYRKATRSLSIEISKVVFSETNTDSSKIRSSDVEKGKSPKRTQFRRATRSASVDTKTFEKSISSSSIHGNLDKNKMHLANKTSSNSNLAICELNSFNIDKKKEAKSNKCNISDEMAVTSEPISTRRSSREFRRDTLLDRSVANQDDINFKKAQSKLSAIGTTIEEIIVDQNLPSKKKVANKKPKQKETFAIDSNDNTQKVKVKDLKKSEGKQKRIQEYYGKKLLKPKRLTNEIDIVPVIVDDNKIKLNKYSGGKSKKINKEKSDLKIITPVVNRKRQAESESRKDENCAKSDTPEVKKSKLMIEKDNSILIKTNSKSNIETNKKKMPIKKSQLIEKRNKSIPGNDSVEKQNVVDSKSKPDKGKTNKIEITAKASSIKRNIDDTKTIPKEKLCSESKNIPADDSVEKQNVIDHKPKPDKGKTNKIEITAKALSTKRNIDDTKTSPKEKLCSESKNIPANDSVEKENVVDHKSKPDKGKTNKIETTAKGLSTKPNIDDTETSPIEKLRSKSKNIPADDSVEKENVVDHKSKPDKGKINKIETTANALLTKRNIDDTETSPIEKLRSKSKNILADDSVEKQNVVDFKSKPDKGKTNTIETTAKGLSIKRNIDDTETSPIEKLRSKSKNVPAGDSIEKQNVIDRKAKPDKGKTNTIETTAKALSIKRNIDDTKTSSIEKLRSKSKNVPADDKIEKENVIDHKSKPYTGKTNTIETTTKALSIERNIDDTKTSSIERLCSEPKNIAADDSVEKENVVDHKSKPEKDKINKIETTAKALSTKPNIDDAGTGPIEKLRSKSKNFPADDKIENKNVVDHKSKPDKGKTNTILTTAKALSIKRSVDDTKTSPIEKLCSEPKNIPADDSVEKQNVIDSKSKPDKDKLNKTEITAKGLSIKPNIDDTGINPKEKLCSESKNIPADDSIEKQNVIDHKPKPDKGKTNKIEMTAKALSIKRNIDDTKTIPKENLCSKSKNIPADDSVEKENVIDSKSKPDKGKTNKIETAAKGLSIERSIDDTKTSPIEKLCSESKNIHADESIEEQNVVDCKSKPDKGKINKIETTAKALSVKRNIDDTKISPNEKLCSESKNILADDSVEKQNVVDFKSKPDKGKTNKIETTAKALSVKRNIDDTKTSLIEKLSSESKNVPADDRIEKEKVIDSESKPDKANTNKMETKAKALSIKRNIDDTKTSPIGELCSGSKNVPGDDSVEKQNVVDFKSKPDKGKTNKIETTAKALSVKRNIDDTKTSPIGEPCSESKNVPEDDSVQRQNVIDSISKPKKEKTNKIETTTKGLSIKRNIDDTETSPIEKLCSESKNVPADDSIEKQNVVDSKTKINKIETTPKGLSSIKRKNTEETKTTSPKEKPCFESKEIIEKVPDSEINVGKIDEKVVIPVAEIVKVNTQEMDKEINPKSEEKCHEIPINLEESIHSQESQKKSEKTLSELPSNNQEEKHAEVVPDKKPKIKKTQNDLSIRNEVNDLEIIPSVENEEIKKQLIRESLEVKSMLKTKNDELLDLDRNIQTEIEDEKEKLLIAENDTTLQTDPAQSEKIFEENGVGKNNISKSTTTDQNSHGLLKEKYIAEDKPEINSICQQHNDLNENIDNFPKKELNEPHITAMSKTLADDSEISGISLRLNSDRDEEPAMKAIGETSREQVEELNIGSMKQSVKENKSALNVPKTCQIKSIMKKAQQGGVDVSDKKKVTFTIDHIMGINTEKTVKNEAQISTADLDLNSSEEGSSKNAENIKICNTQSFSENTTKKSTKYHCGEPKILNFEQRPLDVMITKDLRGTTPPDLPKLKRKLFEDPEIDSKKQKIQTNPKIEIAKLKRLVKDKLEKGNDMITKSQEFNVTSPTKRRDTRKNIDAIINNLRHNLDTKDAEDLLKSNKTKISSKWKDSEQRHEVTVFEIIEEDKSRKAVNEVGIRSEIANDDLNRVREINKMQTSLMDMDGESSSPHITNSESSNAADITTVNQESSASKDSEMITKLQPAQEEGEIKLEKTRLLKDSITLDEEIMLNDFNSKDRQDTISEEMLEDISDRVGKSNVLENTESKNDINSPIEIDTTKETDKNENCKDKIADDPNVATNYIRDDAMDTVKPLTEKMVVDDITTSIDTNSNDNFIKSATKKLIAEEVKNSSFYNLVTCAPLEKLMATTITNDSTNCNDSITPRELEKPINNGNDNSVLSPPDSLVIEKSTDQENIKPSNDFINSLQLRRSNHEEINSASSDCVKSLQSENSIVAEVTSPDLTNSANIDLISEVGANSVVTAEMSNSTVSISDTNETSLEASSIIFEEKQKKPDDILLNFNNNNKSGLFRGMNTDPITTDYNEPIAQLDKTLELKCSPDDPAMPDMSISAASQMTNLIQNDVPWPNVAVCNSFLLNDNFEQQTDDPIPDKIFSNPIKDLNVVCSKPIEYSRSKRIDESDKQNISPCKIQDKTVDVSNLRIKDEDASPSVVCESGELVAMTTEISPFVSDPILATNAGELNSSVSFANVNPENANSVPGKSFDAIDEDQTSLTENVKVYIQITPGTATDHNYSMGGPLLGGKCENTDLPTKQLRAERDNHGSTEGLDNSPVENDNIFSFSEQVNLIENNLTQEKNRSLNQSPIDANADYPFLNQETQLSSTFMENQDASQQQQDNQISIDYMKLMNLEQECDSDQDGSIISLIEDFSNPMSVETMNDIQLKHSKFIETNNCMNQPFFPLTGLDLADIEGINDTGITTRPFQYGDDHGNSILKEIKQEQLPEKVTVKINEHDFASTDRIKEINCPENPQLSKDDIIGSVQNEMMSNQHRTFTEKAEDNPPKKTNRDSPLTTFSTAMKAKAMADIERKKSEGKRKEIHSGYPIRQNKKTPVLAPIKTASPPLIKNSPFITERNSNSSSPIIKSPRRVQQRQSPYTKEEPVIPVKDQLAITDQKSPIDNKTERMKSIAIEKPKENIKEIVQGKLQDLLSTFSIIKSSNEAPKPPMTKITLDSPTAFGSCEMNSTLYDTVKRKRRQPTERLIDKLSLEILVKGNKNQPKQYCKEPNKPKQYGKDQTKTKRLDKSVGKHLMDYDDSSLSDEPGKFYKRFKKDDNSDDEFLSKPRPRTEDELSRAFDALQKGDDAPKKTDDPKNYENRGLKVGVDDTKISQIPTDLDLKMPTSLHKLPRFYQSKLVPSQPYGPSNVILNSRYQQRDTYRHYQTSRTYSPLNPRDLRYTHTRQPSNSKHLSGGAEVSTRRTNSKPTPDLPCRLRPSLGTNVESDWWRNVNAVIKKPPPVIFAADKKQ